MNRSGLSAVAAAIVAGIMIGCGVAVSGVLDPGKIKRFLDLSAIDEDDWNANIALVVAASVLVTMAAMRLGRRYQPAPPRGAIEAAARRGIDRPLVLGSALFGIGCGLSGLGPETAIADIICLTPPVWYFVIAMALGALAVYGWRQQHGKPEGK